MAIKELFPFSPEAVSRDRLFCTFRFGIFVNNEMIFKESKVKTEWKEEKERQKRFTNDDKMNVDNNNQMDILQSHQTKD